MKNEKQNSKPAEVEVEASTVGNIVLENRGEFDPIALQVFGLSVKPNTENAIGYFGTGLKYAIAILLREYRTFQIHAGNEVYNFTQEAQVFRGQTVPRVFCNGTPLPFSADLGRDWQLWEAYRELVSNMKDEGGREVEAVPVDTKGMTYIVAQLADVDYRDVFLKLPTDVAIVPCDDMSNNIEMYDMPSNVLYYRGIRTSEIFKPQLVTYNLLIAALTENRGFASLSTVMGTIAARWLVEPSVELCEKLYLHSRGYLEEQIPFNYGTLGDTMFEVCQRFDSKDRWKHPSLQELFHSQRSNNTIFTKADLTDIQARTLTVIKESLTALGFPVVGVDFHIASYLGKYETLLNRTMEDLTSAYEPDELPEGLVGEIWILDSMLDGIDEDKLNDYEQGEDELLMRHLIVRIAKESVALHFGTTPDNTNIEYNLTERLFTSTRQLALKDVKLSSYEGNLMVDWDNLH